jgi:ribonucleoside-diphosphate reductase beta chain
VTAAERNLLTQIFRFFTQADVEVNNCYMKQYSQVFKPTEVLMMLSAFSNTETIHVAAYSHLLDTIGMPEAEYQAFLKYKQMKDKYDYMQGFNVSSKHEIAKMLAAFGAFTEGLQLFASFAILLNFPRFGKMKGMGQIISWSVRDETLHCVSIIRLFRTFVQENPEVWSEALRRDIYFTCATIVDHEDAFIDLAFEQGPVEGLAAREVKDYIRYIADRRLIQLGLNPLYHLERNPLPWLDEMLNAVEHANFFENRSTEYSKAATTGSWDEVWSDMDGARPAEGQ